MTGAREEILARIRSALKGEAIPQSYESPEPAVQNIADADLLLPRIHEELKRVGASVYTARNLDSAATVIGEIAKSHDTKSVVSWSSSPIDTRLVEKLIQLGLSLVKDQGETSEQFQGAAENAGIGVTGVDYAIADTGTLVLVSGKGKARSASLLPAVHVAIVERDRILSDIQQVFSRLAIRSPVEAPSAVTFITGPSRTADIELTLVVGVHGPGELHVVLME